MAASVSTGGRNAMMDALTALISTSCKIRIYDGARPANVGTAVAGTLLVELTGNAGAFAPGASSGVSTANAITSGVAVASGYGRYARILTSGSTAVVDVNVAEAWVASTSYVLTQQVSNGGKTYKCTTAGTTAGSGGPTGTGSGITDGTAVWAYVGTTDIILGTTSIGAGATVSISALTITDGNA